MGRFSINDANKYGQNGGGSSYFSLKNDRDVAKVRFMYNSAEDIEGYAVHEVMVGDRKRYVSCLRDYNSPMEDCPLCSAGYFQQAKLYVPLYDVNSGTVKYWERGKKFLGKLSGLTERYPRLVSQEFEIERHGAKGSKDTSYEIFPIGIPDNTTLADLPKAEPVLGKIILDKSASEMREYLATGSFPDNNSNGGYSKPNGGEEYRRRTPSKTDKF